MTTRIKRIAIVGLVLLVAGCLLLPAQAVLAEFGIDPGKVFVDNLFPGAQADIDLTVYNQGDDEVTYRAVPRLPDYTADDYEPLPYLGWVSVTPETFSIKETGSEAMIQVELASRILISTRDAEAATPGETLTEPETPTPEPKPKPKPEPGDVEISTPEPETPAGTSGNRLLGPILGGLVGVVIVGEGIYFWNKRRKRKAASE